MSGEKFRLVFFGEVIEGADVATVRNNVRQLLNTDDAGIEMLFSSASITVKNNIDRDNALRYKAAFEKTGARCYIEPLEDVSGNG